ncbi:MULTISPECIES: heme-copper oxidase subunit III [Halobellus]|jgi:cytochrome c oxidase subunit 3|uniref:cytochrome c oxidase subunit 3 n=1 Tax=Halobellus TaxID=1073986 RepID=UPI000EF1FCB7|nr:MULTISPECIES: heme-copper oxidase subunit III [Halobellus]MDQ2053544.1 heme-copper oxidase subunit III [Halobellus sp. H-GB7]RLM94703.1 heme-copper oxidase subunit III [Halobellus sp. Atlit-38R]
MGTEEAHDDHGHHLPAVEDWPRGFGEASWWPFVTAVGGAGVYVAAALYILGRGDGAIVSPLAGPMALVATVGVFLVGLYGWVYHAFVVKFWSREASSQSANKLRWGMLAFLGSELATFGALFGYYFYIRAGDWASIFTGVPNLTGSLILINTTILVVSSITLHYAHVAIRNGDRQNFLIGLAMTLLLGVIFIGGQIYEYYEFIVHADFTLTSGFFASAFFGLTGLHGLHVSLGAVLLGIVFVRALMGQYSAERHVSVSTASMYWHFVDVVWIFLVVVLYVGAEVGV